MLPTLFEIAGEAVPAYFTLLLIGMALATLLSARAAQKVGQDREVIIDLGLYSLIFGIIGSRIQHVLADGYFWDYVNVCIDPSKVGWHITHAQCTRAEGIWDVAAQVCRPKERNCLAWLEFWNGGLAYYGGFIGGVAGGLWWFKRMRFPLALGSDLVAPWIALGLFFGRMGCFLGGCCFGIHTTGPLGVVFPAWSPASESQWRAHQLDSPSLPSLPVYPTQLYEALGCLVIAGFLGFYLQQRKRFHGQVILAFVLLYAALRFGVEILRADDRGIFGGISTSQWISLVISGISLYVYIKYFKKKQ